MYDRTAATDPAVIDRWDDGVGWLAHPDEDGQRASHAVRDDAGDVWLFDPLVAPGVDDLVCDLAANGSDARPEDPAAAVAGVVVCSDYHARDAGTFAERYDVAVHVPSFVDRSAQRIDAPVERFDDGVAGFDVRHVSPMHAWDEAVAYRERDRTLYVPDFLSPVSKFTVGGERIGLPTASRLFPPTDRFAGIHPDRVVFGHGAGIVDEADAALRDALENARRRLPMALIRNLPGELRAALGALG